MVAKRLKGIRPWHYPRLLQAYGSGLGERRAPFLLYANMDFGAPRAEDTNEILEFERQLSHAEWNDARILDFLKKHQQEFRRCLDWVINDFFVDVDEQLADAYGSREIWEQNPEVNFFRQHGLEHAGVTIEPYWGRDEDYFDGLQLAQKKPRDPLDPIVWDVIAHLSVYGTIAVRRCAYSRCGKFFRPRTKRKRFHSDSCRALHNVPDDLSDEIDAFRAKKKKYMRDYRQIPDVKKRVPKSSPKARSRRGTHSAKRKDIRVLLMEELTKPQN